VTGESTKETVKTIAQGRPGVSGEPVVTTLVCFVLFRTRGCGCGGHPAFPAPSVLGGDKDRASLGRFRAARRRRLVSSTSVIARSGSDEAIHTSSLLRARIA